MGKDQAVGVREQRDPSAAAAPEVEREIAPEVPLS